jgi:hypothetical protein
VLLPSARRQESTETWWASGAGCQGRRMAIRAPRHAPVTAVRVPHRRSPASR